MGRIRTIKPEFWVSEQIVECSPNARLLFIGMWNFCDDGGNHPASPKSLKMQVFPGDDFTVGYISELVAELENQGLIIDYQADDGKRYWHVTGWHHQKIDRPSFKYPKFDECSTNDRRTPPPGKDSNGGDSNGGGEEKNAPAKNENQTPVQGQKNTPPSSAAPSPVESAWRPSDPDAELNEMLQDDLCRERFFRQCHIPIEQFGTYIENFRLKAKTEGKGYANRADFRSHFFSWSRTEYEHTQKQNPKDAKLTFHTPDTIREGIEFAERFAAERRAQNARP